MRNGFFGKLFSLLFAGCGVIALAAPLAVSAAPVATQETQVPGFYRMKVGDLEVTALYDGYVNIDPKLFKGIEAGGIQSLMARMFQETSPGVQTAINAYLVNTGSNLILIDAGIGAVALPGADAGHIVGNIRAAGYKEEDVDTVLLTHLHADHAGGLNQDGKMRFPNATVYVAKSEADFWLSKAAMEKAAPEMQAFFKLAQDAVAPYIAAGKLKFYSSGENILPGVEIVPSPGHTPGHTAYLFTSKGQKLLLWGDLVHNFAVQFPHPEVFVDFDVNGEQAIASRKKLFADAAANRLWVGSAHLPFPGLGHVRAEEKGAYAWIPAEFGPVRAVK